MFDDLRYRWAVRKHLKDYMVLSRTYDEMPDDPENPGDEPRYKYTVGKQLNIHSAELDDFRSKYLIQQAYKYHVPIPYDEESWEQRRYTKERVLTAAAAQKLRGDIRAEQKADWEYWQGRVTLGLALIGSIFGVLAFFKR
jgi:hypothetical protein